MKKRIFGFETEYALIPDPKTSRVNSFNLFNMLQWAVSLSSRVARYNRKIGFFLENGSLVNYEARAVSFLDSRLIESATCECTSPREAITYQRALESILLEALQRVKGLFRSVGDVNISKASVDWAGNTFGCHENYFVQDRRTFKSVILNLLGLGVFSVILFFYLILRLVSEVWSLLWLGLLIAKNFRSLLRAMEKNNGPWDRFAEAASESEPGEPTETDSAEAAALSEMDQDPITLLENAMAHQLVLWEGVYKFLLGPLVKPYSWLVTRANFTPFTKDLTSHIVTRLLFCGSGRVSDDGTFALSQKSLGIDRLAAVFFDESTKPVFDFKLFLFSPLSCFSEWKQLQIMFSDSNMCQHSEYLKIGTTAMVIELIEEGHDLSSLRLASPLQALREMDSPQGIFKPLKMADGSMKTALEIQQTLLHMSREMVKKDKVAPFWAREILEAWEGVIRDLTNRGPAGLANRIDWAVKYILCRNVAGSMGEETLRKYVPVILYLEQNDMDSTRFMLPVREMPQGLREAAEKLAPQVSDMIRLAGLDGARIHEAARIYFGARKIDFRFHDLDPTRGYQRGLEEEGYLLTLLRPEEIRTARTLPPSGTRAAVRGYYIRRGAETGRDVKTNWKKLRLSKPWRTVSLKDPFCFTPPFEI